VKLHNLIFLGMVLGVAIGLGLYYANQSAVSAGSDSPAIYTHGLWWLNLLGTTIFMGALKMIIAPLIFASIVAGVTSLPDLRELGAIGWKTLVYYITTTTIAVAIGLAAVLIIQPGNKASSVEQRELRRAELVERQREYEAQTNQPAFAEGNRATGAYLAWLAQREGAARAGGAEAGKYASLTSAEGRTPGTIFKEDIVQPILTNPFASLASMNALGIIFFALLLGIACTSIGPRAAPVIAFFQGLNETIMLITGWLMAISPFAVMCIAAELIAKTGPRVFGSLGWYCGTVVGGIAIHIVFLLMVCWIVGRVSPLRLWRGLSEALLIAFTTRSSSATLPVTIENVTRELKVSPKVANFSLPLGATMNMDGTALYEGVAVIFLLQIYGPLDDVLVTIGGMTTLLIFITAVLASVGAAAVPNAGLVTMVLVAGAVGLPIYYIPLIFAVDSVLDMFRTGTNVLGDAIGAVVVNRLEGGRLGEPVAPVAPV